MASSSENENEGGNVHLLVLVHGMWGNPGHLKGLHKAMSELRCQSTSEVGPAGEKLEILLAQTNRDEYTYDGIDWGGERVAEEIYEEIKRLEDAGKKVTRFSITGYSHGGLVSRYVVGILYQRKFFDNVTPVNFNTFATPHIGLPRYRTFLSSLTQYLGPKLLSRTGEQFYGVDKWSARGRTLLEVMADPDRVFYQALCSFEQLRIYANAVNDQTVPYPAAAIEADDPFYNHMTNGIEIELDEEYAPLIKSYKLPDTPPVLPPAPKPLTLEWVRKFKLPLPPPLQFKFPYNILFYIATPLILPLFFILVLSRLSLASSASRKRIRLMEKDTSAVDRLVHVIAKLERGVEDAVADMMDEPGSSPAVRTPSSEPDILSSSPELGLMGTEAKDVPREEVPAPPRHLILTDLQLKLVRLLNTLPKLKKERAFIPSVRNAHGVLICRDTQVFAFHKLGEGALRHWAYHFIM